MNRQDRDRYDYGRYEGYSNDEQYHSARNLTNEFEQRYRGERDQDSYRDRPVRSYHEGSDIEDDYNRQRRTSNNYRNRSEFKRQDRDEKVNYFGHYNDNQDNYRGDEDFYREEHDSYQGHGDRSIRSGFPGEYGSYNRGNYSGSRGQQDYRSWNEYVSSHSNPDRDHNYGTRDDYRSSGYSRGRDYSDGSSYSGQYGADEDSNYNRDRNQMRHNRWYDSNERTRYY
ncbi:hypothetical protein H8S95_03160 [Pontibacter sp. KCTC 32443]|uniref:hypothetical protein n=1 Tax=Pontibacter TaxID=323449 RepID=UPI00164DDF10|nr:MULTISPECIES: hypothetical protein [Pontibacter]MBC5773051.1 hypothetical protein [Pontibacter sp. KCTC 32443]